MALTLHNYYRRRRPRDLPKSLSGIYLLFGEVFASGIKIDVGNSCSTKFWLDHWIGDDTLDSLLPNLFVLARDSSSTVYTQFAFVMVE